MIKTLVLSVYYLIYLTMESWVHPLGLMSCFVAMAAGMWEAGKGKIRKINYKIFFLVFVLILYAGIVLIEVNGSITKPGLMGKVLQCFYTIGLCGSGYGAGQVIYRKQSESRKTVTKENRKFLEIIKRGMWLVYGVSLLPLLLISPYVFSKADDYSFGYHAHIAWENTGSLSEVIKAAFVMIAEAWTDWQGTFSSIFFMAIQPGVFSERLYAVVPLLFVALLTVSSCFFMKTVLTDWLGADKTLSRICIWGYLIFVIQRVPDIQSAFLWYNGATHYITSHCALLCALGCIVIWNVKKKKSALIGAALFSIYVGGGNYVTAVGSLLLCLTALFAIGVSKTWKRHGSMIGICIIYLGALALNFMAPGNFVRKGRFEGYPIVTAFFMAFTESFRHMFGEWMHWSVVIFVLFMLPVLWHLVSKAEFEFKYPALVLGYSWCYMASLFFAPLFTLGEVNVGRFQNVMFLEWMLLLLFDLAYLAGWMQRKFRWTCDGFSVETKKYVLGILGLAFCCLGLSLFAEPENYTFSYAWKTWKDPGLETYAKEYWEMVEILDGEEEVAEIKDFSYIPPLFDVSLRHEGLRLFYDKEQVIVKEGK